ncbi:hypothetical protein ACO22_07329 [Paracoccidioides brasiliensis]|uniref:Uncharacterized protein n=1 Tax=Paracoccidioides brasiliensis TaxID=121759 RepID=A0A1D2J4Y2_PARBR|nr:hypothetical protein ACO22_07329 [Paracoccidioides brasiliensis]
MESVYLVGLMISDDLERVHSMPLYYSSLELRNFTVFVINLCEINKQLEKRQDLVEADAESDDKLINNLFE